MCGVAGLQVKSGDTLDVVKLSRLLLLGIEHRGRDATGCAWSDGEGIWWDKAPVTASRYVKRMPVSPTASTVILHTRLATGGAAAKPSVNANNHPFALPGVTGIHNGIVWNTGDLFRAAGAKPETGTDSEALFAALAYRGDRKRTDVLQDVKGDAAVAWLETNYPDRLFLARLEMRPLCVATLASGSVLFASEWEVIRKAAAECGLKVARWQYVPEWTYLVLRNGEATQVIRMTRRAASARVASKSKWQPTRYWWEDADDDGTWAQDRVNPALALGTGDDDDDWRYRWTSSEAEQRVAAQLTQARHDRKRERHLSAVKDGV